MGRGVYPATEREHVAMHLFDERSTPLGGQNANTEFINKQSFGLSSAASSAWLSASPLLNLVSLLLLGASTWR